MRLQHINILFLCVGLFLFCSCGNFEKIRKSSDVNFKMTKANEYYDKQDYQHANELYKELMPIMKSTRNYEALCYKYSYTFYYLKDYIQASYHFKNFTETFPASKNAEECEYLSALCLYKYSPKFTLDQTNTVKAYETLQSYLNKYPKSERAKEAGEYIDQTRRKLELKEADAAKLYFNIGQYKAATVAYKSVLRDYPDSPNSDLYQLMIIKAMYKYAYASIIEKQEERYATAISAYNDFKELYPKSKYQEEAEKLFKDSDNNVKKIKNELPK